MQSTSFSSIVFIDLEVTKHTQTIASIGAYIDEENGFEGQSLHELIRLCIQQTPSYVCGHNFMDHDKHYLENSTFNALLQRLKILDTLYLSLLLFPDKVTHKLEKPYKTEAHIANSPFGDSVATKELLTLLVERFYSLDESLKQALYLLLNTHAIYAPFFEYIAYRLTAGDKIVTTAILDRVLHHSHIINIQGDSYRLKEKKQTGVLHSEIYKFEAKSSNQSSQNSEVV